MLFFYSAYEYIYTKHKLSNFTLLLILYITTTIDVQVYTCYKYHAYLPDNAFLISAFHTTKACHGNYWFRSFSCDSGQAIDIVNVFLVDDECRWRCCPDQPYCFAHLEDVDHNAYRRILTQCNGEQSCTDLAVPPRQYIWCPEQHISDYVQIEYLCVSGIVKPNLKPAQIYKTSQAKVLLQYYIISNLRSELC